MPKTMNKSQKYKGAGGKKGGAKFSKNPTSGVKSAKELGLKVESMGIGKRKAKSHKGRKILEAKLGKVVEDPKTAIFIKGNKTSQNVMELMKDLSLLRGPEMSKLFLRRGYDVHPFEDVSLVESMAAKQDCALFVTGTQQKKRPENLIFGRMFCEHLLDMFEFGVSNYKSIKQFNAKEASNQILPVLSFQGEQFDFSDKHKRFKNFLIDFFKVGQYEEVNVAELKRVMIFTADGENKINCKQFEILKAFNESDVKQRKLPLNEIGPHFDLTFRRDRIADGEQYKAACKQPKVENPDKKKYRKNQYYDEWGAKRGKVFLQHNDTSTLATRKWKKQQQPIGEAITEQRQRIALEGEDL